MPKETAIENELAAQINSSVWLRSVHPQFARSVLRAGNPEKLERGTLIYERGDPPGGTYFVVDGMVSVGMDDSKSSILAGHVFKRGDCFGEIPTVTDTARQIDTMALRDCTLLKVSLQDLREICETEPQGWRWLAVLMAINSGVAVQMARDLLISDPKQRLISVVRRLVGQDSLPFDLDLTQTELAEMCAFSRGVASRVLGELEAIGAVHRNYGTIRINAHQIWR